MIKTVTPGVVGLREHFYQDVNAETLFWRPSKEHAWVGGAKAFQHCPLNRETILLACLRQETFFHHPDSFLTG